jgi:hypothetical protein
MNKPLDLDDLLLMNNKELKNVFLNGYSFNINELENTQYRGVDLSLPKLANKILWKEFRKTFYRDPESGVLRGWNVRMEQIGWDNPGVAMRMKSGKELTFGHYHALEGDNPLFPKEWQVKNYLDYGIADNTFFDLARFTLAPLVAVNEGSSELLLGREVVKIGGFLIPLPDFWALRLEGTIGEIADRPK